VDTIVPEGGTASPVSATVGSTLDASIDARLSKSRDLFDASKQALADEARRRETDDRSTIAKLIVNVFVWLMVGVVVAVAVGTADKGWTEWKDAAEFLMKLLSSVLLPVVTLVIGYYFGKEKQ
jgi:hypothetical protein